MKFIKLFTILPTLKKLTQSGSYRLPAPRFFSKMSYTDYTIERIPGVTEENKQGLNRMIDIYVAHDPVVSAFKVHQGRQISPPLRNYLLQPIEQGLSFVAFDNQTKQIIGLIINHIDKPACQMDSLRQNVTDENEKELVNFWLSLGNEPKRLENELMFNIEFNIVDPNYRKSGIGLQLGDKSCHLAHEMNQNYVRSECTNAFTAIMADDLGYTREHSIAYADILDSKGNRVFPNVIEPHTHFHIYILYMEKFRGKPYVPLYVQLKKKEQNSKK